MPRRIESKRRNRANDEQGSAPGRPAEVARDQDLRWVGEVRERLLEWFGRFARDLPWRTDRDAYRVLVSEMMLVQTTVAAVVPFFERFIRQYPDFAALAAADEAEVVKAWEGLGYYRRARQLHAAARTIVREHAGVMPDDPAAIRALPGVGRYIAGALLSLAMDRPEPILEANSQRVLARLLAVREEMKVAATRERLWQAAARLVPAENPGDFQPGSHGSGGFGLHAARAWVPGLPVVAAMPGAAAWAARSAAGHDPKPAPPLAVTEAAVVLARGRRVLILKRGPGGLWEHFWEFPTVHLAGVNPAGRAEGRAADLHEAIRRVTGITAEIGPPIKTITYSVTKHRVKLIVHLARRARATPDRARAWSKPAGSSRSAWPSIPSARPAAG